MERVLKSDTKVTTELWRLRIPLAQAIVIPGGRSFTHTHVMLALIKDSHDNCGAGYSRFFNPADVEPCIVAAHASRSATEARRHREHSQGEFL